MNNDLEKDKDDKKWKENLEEIDEDILFNYIDEVLEKFFTVLFVLLVFIGSFVMVEITSENSRLIGSSRDFELFVFTAFLILLIVIVIFLPEEKTIRKFIRNNKLTWLKKKHKDEE